MTSKIWGFDSEFIVEGKGTVQTIQFSDGCEPLRDPYPIDRKNKHTYVLSTANQVKHWLLNHHKALKNNVYGFIVLCDIGSLTEWLGEGAVHPYKLGVQTRANVNYSKAKFKIYDCAPLLQSFGVRRLSDCGDVVGIPKMDRPDWLGKRNPETEDEHNQFTRYAARDAVITSLITQWLIKHWGANPNHLVSAGSLSKQVFNLPKRLKVKRHKLMLRPFEKKIKNMACFAGRSEAFTTGLSKNVFYNDVASLYPVSTAATRALMIDGYERCNIDDLSLVDDFSVTQSEPIRYGWVEGLFHSDNDYWGLPVRGERNYYVVGNHYGLYSTFDLIASKAKILSVNGCWRPTYRKQIHRHNKFVSMLRTKLNRDCDEVTKRYIKGVCNACYGKLGEHKHPSATANFYAFSLILGHSHWIMSRLFDECQALGAKPLAMDTDSIFTTVDMSKEWFRVYDIYGNNIAVNIDLKGYGDLAFFRSKRYILWDQTEPYKLFKNPYIGRMGWNYYAEDFVKLFDGKPRELHTRKDVKHTLKTRQLKAKELPLGYWHQTPEHLNFDDLKRLLSADYKRQRESYDSYELIIDRKNQPSKAWNINEYLENAETDHLNILKTITKETMIDEEEEETGLFRSI